MIRREGSAVSGVCTDGGKRAPVDDSFDLYYHRIEDVDVERIAVADYLQVFLKKADDTFVTPSDVGTMGGNEFPLQSLPPHFWFRLTI